MRFTKRNIIVFVAAAFLLSGCIGVNRDFQNIRTNILASVNDEFERDVEFAVGPGLIYLAGMFVKFADEGDEGIDDILSNVSRVQVGVYKRNGFERGGFNLNYLNEVNDYLRSEGWDYLVKSRDADELSFVYVQSEDEDLNSIFAIALSYDELVMVEVSGNLDELIEVIIREEGLHIAAVE